MSKKSNKSKAKNTNWILPGGLLIILLIVVIVIVATNKPDDSTSSSLPAEITVQDAYQKYQEGVFFLDVREQSEWDSFHIPNTTLIPLGELPNRLSELPGDQPIVVVCRSGNRSQSGRDILLNAGFTDATSMAGGVTEWSRSGYPIEGTRP